jgi:hypothetical protein
MAFFKQIVEKIFLYDFMKLLHSHYLFLIFHRGGDLNLNGRSPSSGVLDQLPSDLLGGSNSHRDDIDFDYPDLASQTRSEDDKGSYIKGHPRCDTLIHLTLHILAS